MKPCWHSLRKSLYGTLQNLTLDKLIEVFWGAFESVDNPIIQEEKPLEQEIADHRAILLAVRRRAVTLAKAALTQHFAHLQARIQRAMNALQATKQTSKTKE